MAKNVCVQQLCIIPVIVGTCTVHCYLLTYRTYTGTVCRQAKVLTIPSLLQELLLYFVHSTVLQLISHPRDVLYLTK